ncbi:MAG: hypothetical protein N5P05_003894 [Chroococcopsis gigantea SAG 12.99]|jgi:heme-degrading monooxygenase HmoA|nr:antibiotic biosynthesis monooxygenase [Chlorogloea purpurea SAG 13.99]MDV3002288.1 hypothetical protein [Chroococcopsis gigantea SAG 12.99]
MITFTRTFWLDTDARSEAMAKIQRLYTEVMPLQPGYIASNLIFAQDGNQLTAVANWESEEQFLALQDTDAFRDLARYIG